MGQFNRDVWRRFMAIARPFWFSQEKATALLLLAGLLTLMLAVNGLNVAINYVGGDFMTALSGKDTHQFYRLLFMYGAVFVVGTPIVVFYSWVQQKLGIQWRRWLTDHFINQYFTNRAYYHLNSNPTIDNPDERIAQDINSFTSGALSFFLVILSSIVTLFSFTAILWSISKSLVWVLLAYSLVGSIATVFLGRRLIGLNFNQLKREANFRFGLIHIRNNVESVAFYNGEQQESNQIKDRFADVFSNFNLLIGWQRNLGFLTTGYNYFVVIIPSLVIAPLYFAGQVKFGVITQADLAFTQVLASLSLIVSQFQDLSAFIAVINRLGGFAEALHAPGDPNRAVIDCRVDAKLALEQVTLKVPDSSRTLVRDLTLSVKPGQGVLIMGPSGSGKSSILRALAGLWDAGAGQIVRPDLAQMMFLPQRPYMVLGSLKAQLLYPNLDPAIDDQQLLDVLRCVNLAHLPQQVGGLEAVENWSDFLSLGEQQRLSFARLLLARPACAILDEATSALDTPNEESLYRQLQATSTRFVSVGHRNSLTPYHHQILQLSGEGSWTVHGLENQLIPEIISQPVEAFQTI